LEETTSLLILAQMELLEPLMISFVDLEMMMSSSLMMTLKLLLDLMENSELTMM
jgi:hypothetical protein